MILENGVLRIGETYEYTVPGYETMWWNVSRAKLEVRGDGLLTTVDIAREEMANIASRNEWDESHLAHVDPAQPGIGAPLVIDGVGLIYVLIDGTHRCVRALRDGLIFRAHLLTDAAAERCTLRGDARLRVPAR